MDEPTETYAFRCRNCNGLEAAEHAGENAVPHACRFCGAGVHWEIEGGAPVKKLDPDNWIVLAALPANELAPIRKFHAIDADAIVAHDPVASAEVREPRLVSVSATEGMGTEDAAG